jgi:hypothetical protein
MIMAIEPLGRLFNVVPIAASVGLSLKNAAGVLFVCTGNDTFSLTASATFAGSYSSTGWTPITRKYTNTATNGTAAWVKAAQAAAAAVTISSGTVAFWLDGASLLDTMTYVKCTPSSAGLVTAVFADLFAARTPANLPIVSA